MGRFEVKEVGASDAGLEGPGFWEQGGEGEEGGKDEMEKCNIIPQIQPKQIYY